MGLGKGQFMRYMYLRVVAQLVLDEAQQVLLVHARRVVHVRVHLGVVRVCVEGCGGGWRGVKVGQYEGARERA